LRDIATVAVPAGDLSHIRIRHRRLNEVLFEVVQCPTGRGNAFQQQSATLVLRRRRILPLRLVPLRLTGIVQGPENHADQDVDQGEGGEQHV
jgi:hypothetical protein